MSAIQSIFFPITHLVEMGGPVIAILLAVSIFALTIGLYQLWRHHGARVGRHQDIRRAIAQWDSGDREAAQSTLVKSRHYLAPILRLGTELKDLSGARQRLEAEAEQKFASQERGLRTLDIIAQLAPLLGLFGTVIGMIEAFQALQGAGSQVDPSVLAGGIWVALLTTAAGLAVAMPASIALSWFEARMDAERTLAETAFATILTPTESDMAAQAKEPAFHVA